MQHLSYTSQFSIIYLFQDLCFLDSKVIHMLAINEKKKKKKTLVDSTHKKFNINNRL